MMHKFEDLLGQLNWEQERQSIYDKQAKDVEKALLKEKCNLEDFKAFISPAATGYLEQMAQKSQRLTQERFGKTIQMYLPMYLSSVCHNICTYCGFSFMNKIPRKILNPMEIQQEAEAIKKLGFDHLLLVTGEANKAVGVTYFEKAIKQLSPLFSNLSLEVQPLRQEEYERLVRAGLYSVLVYQETYSRESYKRYHLKGRKSNFNFRLETPERLGRAGVHKIGLGALLGLNDWRTDSFFTAVHLSFMEKNYWKSKYSISFPRLRPHAGGMEPKTTMSDSDLVQLICAYRLFNQEVELSMSTREDQVFRDHVIQLGITSTSAGSKTNPGGYSVAPQSLEQFSIDDNRSPETVERAIKASGYEVVWKDWDKALQ